MRKIFALILCLSFGLNLFSQDIRITHGPYLYDMTDEGVTVVWKTNNPALSWVEVAPHSGESFYAKEHPRYYETVAGRRQAMRTLHRVRISGLKDGTMYDYRIFSKEVKKWEYSDKVEYGDIASSNVYNQKPFSFKTYSKTATTSSFLVFNDIHGKADFMKNLSDSINFKEFDFVALNGDMISFLNNEDELFSGFLDACSAMFAKEVPMIYTRGNHEGRGSFADNLVDYFPTRDGKFYQMYKVGKICYLALDCGEDKPDSDTEYSGLADFDKYREDEAEWLKKVISSAEFKESDVRIVFLHIPPMIGSWHGNKHLKKLFLPILNEAKIDVMLSGHTHKYHFRPANKEVNFPTVVNDNKSYLKCDVTDNKIVIQVIGVGGKVSHTHEFPRSK